MQPIPAIQTLLGYLGTVGKALKGILGLPTNVKVDANLKVQVGLTPSLEQLIGQLVPKEEPVEYWIRANKGLLEQDEHKFQVLADLGISDIAMGTEAMLQHPDNVPEMAQITNLFIKEYVLASPRGGGDPHLLPPSTLVDAFRHILRTQGQTDATMDIVTRFLEEEGRVRLERKPTDDEY